MVLYYASMEIVMVHYRKISSQLSASSHCLLHMFWCKHTILYYDDGAPRNWRITYNNKRPHYRDFFIQSHK